MLQPVQMRSSLAMLTGRLPMLQPVEQEQAPKQPSAEQLLAIKAAVANLNSLEEASRLEASLAQGQMPSEITAQIEQQKAALAQQPQANGTAVAGGDEALAMDQG